MLSLSLSLLLPPLELLLLGIALLLLFYVLSVVCENALEPCLEELSDRFEIPHDVACATFLALGSSAPEIFINSAAVVKNDLRSSEVSVGTIFGSALLAFTLIPACSAFVARPSVSSTRGKSRGSQRNPPSESDNDVLDTSGLHLQSIPTFRDVGFFSIGMFAFVMFSRDGLVTLGESAVLVALFVFYLISMRILAKYYVHNDEPHTFILEEEDVEEDHHHHHIRAHDVPNGYGTMTAIVGESDKIMEDKREETGSRASDDTTEDDDGDDGNFVEKCIPSSLVRLVKTLTPPFGVNGRRRDEIRKRLWFTLSVSVLYLIFISEACLVIAVQIATVSGLSNHFLGFVIVAIGAQIDDLFVSLAVARKGEGSSSLANAVGSQVFNVSLALGLPFLLSNLMREKPVQVDGSTSVATGYFIVAVVSLFVGLVFTRFPYFPSCLPRRFGGRGAATGSSYSPVLYKEGGVVLFIAYAAAVLGAFEYGLLSKMDGE